MLEAHEKTQIWLAHELGVDFRTVNRYFNNHRQPSVKTLFEIARLLKISPRELLSE